MEDLATLMTAIDNQTPFVCGGQFVRDERGCLHWTVATRATFAFGSGPIRLHEAQTPVCRSPEYFTTADASPLKYGCDFNPPRQATDLLLHAQAHAPAGRAVDEVQVGFELGPHRKILTVTGPRYFEQGLAGLALSKPLPFERAALSYDQTWGGAHTAPGDDWSNPLGRGMAASERELLGKEAPRLFQRDGAGRELRRAVGFGPLPVAWLPRARLAGTMDETWFKQVCPRMPADFQPSFYQDAPADQQFTLRLQGGERLVLHGMSATSPLTLDLPAPRFRGIARIRGQIVAAPTLLETVIVHVEERQLIMVWSTAWPATETEVNGTRIEAVAS